VKARRRADSPAIRALAPSDQLRAVRGGAAVSECSQLGELGYHSRYPEDLPSSLPALAPCMRTSSRRCASHTSSSWRLLGSDLSQHGDPLPQSHPDPRTHAEQSQQGVIHESSRLESCSRSRRGRRSSSRVASGTRTLRTSPRSSWRTSKLLSFRPSIRSAFARRGRRSTSMLEESMTRWPSFSKFRCAQNPSLELHNR